MQVKLEGELTLARASEIKPLLVDAVAQGGDLDIDVSAITEVDVAGLQLLCATHRCLDRKGRSLNIAGASEAFRAGTARAGFNGEVACLASCIWRKVHG